MAANRVNTTGVVTGRFKCSLGLHQANLVREVHSEQDNTLTPQEIRAEVARERREATKARQLDRCTKRKHKRSQAY